MNRPAAMIDFLRRRALATVALTGAATLAAACLSTAVRADPVPPPSPGTLASANPSNLTPHAANGEARAFAQIGDTVYVGGTFTKAKAPGAGSWTSRPYLFAYDQDTGALRSAFSPQLDGTVNALAVSPDGKLIVGGAFRTVNGVTRKNLVELDPTTGATVSSWTGRSDGGVVRALSVRGDKLYLGGAFHWIDGTAHSLLARLDAGTGAIDPTFQVDASVPRDGSAYVWTMAVSPDGSTLVAGGNFTEVDGQPRNQVVMVDDLGGTPTVANWSTRRYTPKCYPSFISYVTDIDFSDDGDYFVIGANGGRGTGANCDSVSRWETAARGSDLTHTWIDYTGTDSVTAVQATDGVVYAAGHFRWLNNANGNDAAGDGAVDRLGIGALDAGNGLPLGWNPRRSAGNNLPSGGTAWGSDVPELWRGTDGVYFGQNSDGMGGEYHGRLGMFPLAGGRAVSDANAPAGDTGYLYLGTGNGELTRVPYQGGSLGTPTTTSQPHLTHAGAAWMLGNKLYWARSGVSNSLQFSVFNGTVGASWTNGYDDWFAADELTGGFALDGRLYYTRSGDDTLHYRYIEPDSYVVGCTEFDLHTTGVDWGSVRGMTVVDGHLVYGATDGSLRSVAFDPAASTAVDGSSAAVLAGPTAGLSWSHATLFFATR